MNTAVSVESRIDQVDVTDDTITAHLVDGRVISVPLVWSWRLSEATAAQRANWKLIGDGHGVHWPDIDEDISAEGMLNGIPASRSRQAVRSKPAAANKALHRRAALDGRRNRKSVHARVQGSKRNARSRRERLKEAWSASAGRARRTETGSEPYTGGRAGT
jgi:hypothetical protein